MAVCNALLCAHLHDNLVEANILLKEVCNARYLVCEPLHDVQEGVSTLLRAMHNELLLASLHDVVEASTL